jgi:hypothetical protein
MLPLIANFSRFADLWWFGDEWDLLGGMAQRGLISWSLEPFAENVVPLFKLLWGASVHLFAGGYLSLIVVVWLTHAVTLVMFARILMRLGLPLYQTTFAVVLAGIPWSNIETLTWAVQWHSVLALTLCLAAWLCLLSLLDSERPRPALVALYSACLIGAPMFHARGILNGIGMTVWLICYTRFTRLRLAALSMLLALAMAAFTHFYAGGAARQPHDLSAMCRFGLFYYLLSPLFRLVYVAASSVGLWPALWLGAVKIGVIAAALYLSQGAIRAGLAALAVMDLGYAAILGFGRYLTGTEAAVSSRYQYLALFCFAPCLGVVVGSVFCLTADTKGARLWLFFLLLGCTCIWTGRRWSSEILAWSHWRGSDVRAAVATAPPGQTIAFSGTTAERARELVKQYRLH